MSKIMRVFISDDDEKKLAHIAKELSRTESDLLDSAVAESINDYFRGRIVPTLKETTHHD